jgi:hypothetical protein
LRSLEWVHARCREDGDCLIWEGSTDAGGRPKVSIKAGALTRTVQPRRMAWEAAKGPITHKRVVTVTCGNPLCLNPAHMELISKGEVVHRTAQRPDTQRRRYLAGLKSRERSNLDLEKVRYIRSCNLTLEEVSKELGISPTSASAIRRGKRWRDYENNPFAGLI